MLDNPTISLSPDEDDFGLHDAALQGYPESIRKALEMGADINSLDSQGRTVLACIVQGIGFRSLNASDASCVTPDRLESLGILLAHPSISLYTLNATDPRGATPLGAAAGMNFLTLVESILFHSAGTVSVDAMDSRGATALIHASHAGNLQIARLLLQHGARPDFRDAIGKTAIQRALPHPQVLWSCEVALRRHRWRRHTAPTRPSTIWDDVLKQVASSLPKSHDPTPPCYEFVSESCLYTTSSKLSEYVNNGELYLLQTMLFSSPVLPHSSKESIPSPVLVNHPDATGWSPIHYCAAAEQPSTEILMCLYLAGADLCLTTSNERYTPLHCLARSGRCPPAETLRELLGFIVHLVRDLGAPMFARDQCEETCMHLAAEHGNCVEILEFLLELDTNGTVREMRNSRGMTPLEVAKPEFRMAFGLDAEQQRSVSSLSMRTVKPLTTQHSDTVLESILDYNNFNNRLSMLSESTDLSVDIPTICQKFCTELSHLTIVLDTGSIDFTSCSRRLCEAASMLDTILANRRATLSLAQEEFGDLCTQYDRIDTLCSSVTCAIDGELCRRGLRSLHCADRVRESEDSEKTAVTETSTSLALRSRSKSAPSPYKGNSPSNREPTFLRERSKSASSKYSVTRSEGSTKKKTTTSKFTNWLKRTMVPAKFLDDLDVGVSAATEPPLDTIGCTASSDDDADYFEEEELLEYALQSSSTVLNAVRRDLQSLKQCLDTTRETLKKAEDAVRKAEKIGKHALQKRAAKIKTLHLRRMDDELNEFYDIFTHAPSDISPPSRAISLSPSTNSIASATSFASFATVHAQSPISPSGSGRVINEEEEVRIMRRLVVRKTGARMDKVLNEIQFESQWLNIVQEAVRDVKRRTYVS